MANIARLIAITCVLYMGAGLGFSAIQVGKAHADRVAVTICEVSQDCR
jgi:predicted O-methyltransferase YrrM